MIMATMRDAQIYCQSHDKNLELTLHIDIQPRSMKAEGAIACGM